MPSERFFTPRLRGFATTVFSEVNRLAAEHGAINLGQGAPDGDGPDFVKEAAIAALRAGSNQYCRSAGVPELVTAIAEHQRRFYGLAYDAESEVTVTVGATEAIFATLAALVGPGDEVVVFEPFYDSYPASVALAGARLVAVTLEPRANGSFAYDPVALAAAITPQTRVLLLNTPHNPTGKVFRRDELEQLAALCRRHDLIAVTDEVYEHLVFDGEHVPLAALDGMRERTVTLSSTGKTFSFTGWKVGYALAAPELSDAVRAAHQFITFCQPAALQHGMAAALAAGDDYFRELLERYRRQRRLLCDGLAEIGFGVTPPEGTYFVLADIRPLGFDDDVELCRRLPAEVGVAAIPPTSFYLHKERGRHFIRFGFCKRPEVIEEALRRLGALRPHRVTGAAGAVPAPSTGSG